VPRSARRAFGEEAQPGSREQIEEEEDEENAGGGGGEEEESSYHYSFGGGGGGGGGGGVEGPEKGEGVVNPTNKYAVDRVMGLA
jgi:hypothetical protein